VSEAEPTRPPDHGRSRSGRAALWAAAVVVVIVGGFVGAAFLPRWWSHLVGGQVNGSIAAGIALGLVYGFVFSLLPLLVLRLMLRRRHSWKVWLVALAVAILAAAPNLLTLGIVIGRGNAAHAGERTLDVDAPGFRGSVLAGVILAGVAYLFAEYLRVARRRRHREADRLREELRARQRPESGSEA